MTTRLAPAQPPATDVAREWLERFADGWRAPAGAREFIEHFRPMLAEDVVMVQPQLPTIRGMDAFATEFVEPLFALMGDVHGEVEHWAAREDNLYVELSMRATLGGRSVQWRVCDRITLRDGLAIERESYFDPTPLLRAIARSPRVWPRFLSLRLRGLSPRPHRRAL